MAALENPHVWLVAGAGWSGAETTKPLPDGEGLVHDPGRAEGYRKRQPVVRFGFGV